MDTLNIAVLGADGVGKSTFIQRALRAPRPPGNNITTVRLDLDGTALRATFLEVDTEFLEVEEKQPIHWPKQINGHMVPRIDGVLVLYDVTNKESLRELPPIMNALAIAKIPTIIVATKCDSPENLRQVNPDAVSGYFPAAVATFKTSSSVPSSTRDSLQCIIRAALVSKRGAENNKNEAAISRRRAASSAAHLDAPDLNGRPLSQQGKHGRASSDLSLLRGTPPPGSDGGYSYRGTQSRSRIDHSSYGSDAAADDGSVTVSGMLRTHGGVRLDGGGPDTFLDVDESDVESYRHSDDIPILQRGDENFAEKPAKMVGVEFDELVDRLLAPRMTRADNNFADIFLCLYRKFASPGQLLSAILARLEPVMKDKSIPDLTMIQTELRIIEVIAKWVSLYPGDFARSATRRQLENLVRQLAKDPILTPSAQQIRVYLERYIMEDDDTGWAKSDEPDRDSYHGQDPRFTSRNGHRGDGVLNDSMTSLHLEDSRESSSTYGQAQRASADDSGPPRRPVAQFQFHSLDDYEREAATMMPTATLPLNKIRYHIFLDKDTDDIADEITRIDWIMFSSIRIRDLVRHVSLSTEQKEKCRSLKNVNRMISHFNHVARWVSNMILIRDKAKHRAPCLEKFMLIALRLRVLNNYNGLAAVLAGINGTSIHRLAQTKSLVSVEVQRRFARLGLLMGTQKSHFAYRLAWENSPLPRIPFMPLHRRDLVSAEEGSRTFVGPQGDRINWKKFEVLSEVLLPLMKSQGTPYPNLRKDDGSRELILDCKMPIDEEEIYQRSIQVEPTSGMGESSKKKFPWLAK
ncbi:hypothetical protein MCOR07_004222 [Pyricularia oryzae]|uniref:Ras GEF n=1 Tax=Pyricularia grisea TaxID=148305 RepID=A0ABQ8N3X3_PYRGI|nr:hypothetical protein MCOR01_006053 [Pyricularia oryzae]KAI6290855.1 hypothetical protein MCOR33_011011 [Pyricularia grisea]KAI6284391.1 hypothetical protein MCOR26_002022 [Pyricularia oryzae]KAI6319117.1 hypothetical protein MCOR29_005691 [Pyricularia oryzae]KAI6346202.1 hypothetical protein MCOR28_003066 [Pyricularia oryzae]